MTAVRDMLAAWPELQRLNLPDVSLSPDDLRTAARICPKLKSIRAMQLSDEFESHCETADAATSVAAEQPSAGHPLQMIQFCSAQRTMRSGEVKKIARFIYGLFPRLEPTQCGRTMDPLGEREDWRRVVLHIKRLQEVLTGS